MNLHCSVAVLVLSHRPVVTFEGFLRSLALLQGNTQHLDPLPHDQVLEGKLTTIRESNCVPMRVGVGGQLGESYFFGGAYLQVIPKMRGNIVQDKLRPGWKANSNYRASRLALEVAFNSSPKICLLRFAAIHGGSEVGRRDESQRVGWKSMYHQNLASDR